MKKIRFVYLKWRYGCIIRIGKSLENPGQATETVKDEVKKQGGRFVNSLMS